MPGYEVTGTVKVVMDQVRFDSGFTKREFVVTTAEERFPQDIKLECVKERCALLDDIQPGQRVTVSFDIRGNEFKGKYYVSLSAWKVQPAGGSPDEVPFDVPGESLERLMEGKDTEEVPPF